MSACASLAEDWWVAEQLAAGRTYRGRGEDGLRECYRIARARRANAMLAGEPWRHLTPAFILATGEETLPALIVMTMTVLIEQRPELAEHTA